MHIKETFPELYQLRRPVKTEEVRERLQNARGREFWRSLEELAETPELDELIHREFPRHAAEWDEQEGGADRRTFLKLMGASLALAGLSGCSYQPPETIVPYVQQPEEIIPGKPLFFATAMPGPGGVATGLLARSNMGRPTKVEGNPDHPASAGAADIYAQASILELYDPDRSNNVLNRGAVATYPAFRGAVGTALEAQRPKNGAGIRFLTETVTSPTLAAQMRAVLTRFPGARWYQYEAGGANGASAGASLAFGDFATPIYRFADADRVLALDSNFLECGPGSLRYARDFATRRRVRDGEQREPSRLYSVESTPTNTGVFADHRLPVKPSEVELIARAVAAGVGVGGGPAINLAPQHARFVTAVVNDLKAHGGRCVVVPGDEQPAQIHALAHAMNAALGNVGKTVAYIDAVEENPTDQTADLRALIGEIDAGTVEMLIIVGGNPVFTTPADLKLSRERMLRVPFTAHLSLRHDETSNLSLWHVPEAHYLEAWGDARAFDGTVSIIQPLIAPLYNGKSAIEFVGAFSEQPERTGYDLLREYWQANGRNGGAAAVVAPTNANAQQPAPNGPQQSAPAGPGAQPQPNQPTAQQGGPVPARGGNATGGGATTGAVTTTGGPGSGDFEQFWRKVVHDGVVPNTARREKSVAVRGDFGASLAASAPAVASGGNSLEIAFRTDPCVYDGRYANNGWLQELPKPISKLTWDNAAIISPLTAERLGFGTTPDGATAEEAPRRVNNMSKKGGEIIAEVVRLRYRGREVTAPVLIQPGQPDDVVTVHLGYGRERGGRVAGDSANLIGFDAYKIRTADAPWGGPGLEMEKTGDTYPLASTQIHFRMEGREVVRAGTYQEYLRDPKLKHDREEEMPPKPAGENRMPFEGESMYEGFDYSEKQDYNSRGYKWGMAIDLSTCVGCNSCVVACQAENNIPVVGKEQVSRSREMHWLRIDAYFRGLADNPDGVYFMPVPCMHCEQAPCEPVCPVHATVHDPEGMNVMVYNRCIGTRYCSNNCPYKVRRFNFLLYQDWDTPSLKLARNPEVTVRSRGVMEKCTYCIQRTEHAKIEAEKEGRKIRDGEVVTACQATCPTESIIFGDLNDPNSRVTKLHAQQHRYDLLADLNTRPRTVYLASVRNPNPELAPAQGAAPAGERH